MTNNSRNKRRERELRSVALSKVSWAALEKAAVALGASCDDVLELLVQVADGHPILERTDRYGQDSLPQDQNRGRGSGGKMSSND